jgi:hypothetical protein
VEIYTLFTIYSNISVIVEKLFDWDKTLSIIKIENEDEYKLIPPEFFTIIETVLKYKDDLAKVCNEVYDYYFENREPSLNKVNEWASKLTLVYNAIVVVTPVMWDKPEYRLGVLSCVRGIADEIKDVRDVLQTTLELLRKLILGK